jgi:hypothetical protein
MIYTSIRIYALDKGDASKMPAWELVQVARTPEKIVARRMTMALKRDGYFERISASLTCGGFGNDRGVGGIQRGTSRKRPTKYLKESQADNLRAHALGVRL